MAAAAVLRGGSCRVLAYPALHADVISSPATLPTCPRPRGSSRRGTLGEVHGHLHPHEAISRPGIQRNYREDGRTCCFSTPTSPLSSSASPPPPLGKMAAAALANGDVRVGVGGAVPRPTNPMVTPLLTDLYRFSMAYAYWKAGKHLDRAVTVQSKRKLQDSPSSGPRSHRR